MLYAVLLDLSQQQNPKHSNLNFSTCIVVFIRKHSSVSVCNQKPASDCVEDSVIYSIDLVLFVIVSTTRN